MRRLAVGILLLAGLVAPSPPASAAPDPAVMLLVDTSGSMRDDDGTGTVKLDGAKAALGAFLADVPDATHVGMRTYPAGTGDCGSGKEVWKPQRLQRSRLGAEVRSLKADGGTPTAQALLAAARDLDAAGQPLGTVILVSDGESNCTKDGPVCDVAKGLASSGLAITVNTVGFQISEAGREELDCIARVTGGVYSDVKNSDQLADRLNALAQGFLDLDVDAPTQVAMTVGQTGSNGRRIAAKVTNPGLARAVNVRVTLQFVAPNANDPSQSFTATQRPTRYLGNLDPGEERTVEWSFRPPITFGQTTLNWRVVAGVPQGQATERTGAIRVTSEVLLRDAGPLLRDKEHVVILGDSYSAGEGAGSYEAGTDTSSNVCHRSSLTYGTTLFTKPPVNLACSGAVTDDVVSSGEGNQDPRAPGRPLLSQAKQLRALMDAGTTPDLALMTLGGNDINFAGIIASCIMPLDCTTSLHGKSGIEKDFEGAIEGLPVNWNFAVRMIDSVLNSDAAQDARGGRKAPIIVLAYPRIYPSAVGKAARCQGYLTSDEIAFANRVGTELNDTLSLLAEALRRESGSIPVYFASDVEDAVLPDHSMCGAQPWINELNVARTIEGKTAETVNDNRGKLLVVGAATQTFFAPARFTSALAAGAAAAEQFDGTELRTYRHAFHPDKRGYLAMAAGLVRWSNSSDANTPIPKGPLDGATELPSQGEPITLQGSQGSLDLRPNTEYPLSIEGVRPNTEIRVVLHSSQITLASVTSDANGKAVARVVVPTTLRMGKHTLDVLEHGEVGYEVVLTRQVDVSRPMPIWLWLGLLLSAALTGLGVFLLRRAARDPSAAIPSASAG